MKTDNSKSRETDRRWSAIDALLDHALEETFPASDSTAVTIEVVVSDDRPETRESSAR